jgi:hypothetical protein
LKWKYTRVIPTIPLVASEACSQDKRYLTAFTELEQQYSLKSREALFGNQILALLALYYQSLSNCDRLGPTPPLLTERVDVDSGDRRR